MLRWQALTSPPIFHEALKIVLKLSRLQREAILALGCQKTVVLGEVSDVDLLEALQFGKDVLALKWPKD